ncbi:MAG: bifunctional folylpolyglutamate synthase/dihydrofolate synthase, partial [Clostridia bacterium]|nr:bifunctional folylpolyglutamate synthase/dihydrofolate synthase [Clostridia bacterium]
MNYTECLNYIHSLMRFGSRPGLERITELLNRLGDPQEKLNIIHVAGTNGKGSTCTFLSNVLRASGKKVGLYISPFVTVFNERIQINGQPISDDDLANYTERVKAVVERIPDDGCPITEFEFITAVAFLYFFEQGCDAVVLEVGLGGRLDATNVISKPKVSVIARIALDHTSILGNTEAEIAFEKCGIVKNGCPVVTTADNIDEALEVIKQTAKERGCELKISNRNEAEILSSDIFGSNILWCGEEYRISLPGEHQVSNALNAVTAVKLAFPEITLENIKQGLSTTVFPARCEVISKEPLVILDGSHNPNGTGALADLLEKTDIKNATAIVGFMADKDVS